MTSKANWFAQRRWVGFALLSSASFAIMATCVRIISEDLPQSEVVFFRNFFALLVLIPLMLRSQTSLKTACFHLHLLRAISGLCAMYLYFYALNHLHLADALLLNYTSPIFIAIFAVIWLKESMTRHRLWALILSLIGLSLLLHPSSQLFSLAGFAGLASGLLAGLALTTVKQLSSSESSISIVIWFALLSSIISAIPLFWDFIWPQSLAWLWLVAVGVFGSLGQLGLTWAYQHAPATQVSPLGYTSLVFAGLIGYLLWQERPDTFGVIGMLLITLAGITVAKERATPALAPPSAVPILPTTNISPNHRSQ
ncbi:MAG: DMT family transporter [Zetaproteobacteria bacterium]|nr:DMT family transporter [Zetaproteobacteria bacterium]